MNKSQERPGLTVTEFAVVEGSAVLTFVPCKKSESQGSANLRLRELIDRYGVEARFLD